MNDEPAEVLDTSPNQAVVRTPGRRFPGVVIQGDTLSNLARSAIYVAQWLRPRQSAGDPVRDAAQTLLNGLAGRLLHYERVLAEHGIELPYPSPMEKRELEPVGFLPISLSLLVLRCADIQRSQAFYEALGLRFTREQHGQGPVHYSALLGETVIELYPDTERTTADLRLGFSSDLHPSCVSKALQIGGQLLKPNSVDTISAYALIQDPDGHRLELSFHSYDADDIG